MLVIDIVWNSLLSREQAAAFSDHGNESAREPGAGWPHASLDCDNRMHAVGTIPVVAAPAD